MQKKLFIEDINGNKVCGILSNPTKDTNCPIIILCHGFTTSKDSGTNKNLEEIFNSNNISTFRLDFYGHGESYGKFKNVTISKAVNNILGVIKHFKNIGYSKIGVVGSSFGGMASIIASASTNDLYIL